MEHAFEIQKPAPVLPVHYANRPSTLTPEWVDSEFARLNQAAQTAEAANTSARWDQVVLDWNSLRAYLSGEHARLGYSIAQEAENPEIEKAETYFREKITPIWENANFEFLTLLLKSRHRPEMEKRFGSYFFLRNESSLTSTNPKNVDLRVREGELIQRYSKLVACGEITIAGEKMTLSRAIGLQNSEKPELRREAFEKHRQWFVQEHGALAEIFDELVKVRHQMALNLGDENFIPLGYAGMQRTDYGREQVEEFRKALKKEVVPLLKKMREDHAAELGTKTLKPWDGSYQPSLHFPQNIVPIDRQLDQAQNLFDRLSPRLGGHFTRMRKEKLIDLENRKGKRAGAFCTAFPDENRVAIFCNSTGSHTDVSTLTHEMGHAFQGWESQSIELIDLRWPTLDACEIHSMGMEYLSLRHMDCFFDTEHARRFQVTRWKQSLQLLCYVAIVDEFQHWIYSNPKASIDERDLEWNRIFDQYSPGVDYDGIESLKWARWYGQGHIFQAPFYYIDYAIAETGAMQLALMEAEDPKSALESYLELCRLGGTKSVLDIFKSAKMRSPFDPSLIHDLAQYATQQIT